MAGNSRIQGITVEIGGDTGPLSKALQGVNKEIQGTQSQLKDVERLLKMDPGNTELLRQKQRLLGDAIGETKTKLDALKTAEQQAQAQFQKGEISQKQFDGLKREIADTEIKLKSLEKSYKDLGNTASRALQNASDSIKGFGEKTSSLGQKLLPLSAGIVGVGAAAIHTADDLKGAMNDFEAQTLHTFLASGQGAEDFEQVLKNIYAGNYGENYDDIAQSMATVVKNAKDLSPENIEKMTTSAIVLRDTFDYDVQETMRAANMLMDQFGISGEQAFNLIAQGAQSGLDKNGDLLDSINEYSVHFSQLGLNAEDMFNVLDTGAYNGAFSVDKVGDAMKEFGIRVKDGSDSTTDAFQRLGLDAEQMQAAFSQGGEAASEAYWEVWHSLDSLKDPVERNTVGVALFGTMWEDLGDKAVVAMMGTGDSFNSTIDTMKQIDSIKYDTIGEALTGLGRILVANVLTPLIQEVMPGINSFVQRVLEVTKAFSERFASMDSGTKKLIVTIAGIVAAIGPALIVIGKLSTGFGSVVGIVGKVVGLFSGGGGLFAVFGAITGPVGIAVAAVGALVAIFGTLFATNEDFRNKVGEIWGQIQQIFSSVLEQIKGLIQGFVDVVNAIWQTYGSQIMDVISAAFDFVKTYIESALKVVKDVISVVMGLISGDWEKVWNGLKNLVSDVLGGVMNIINSWQQLVQKAFELLGSAVGNVLNALKGVILNIFEGMKTGALNSLNNLKSGAATVIGNVVTTIRNGLGKAVDYVKGLPSQFLGWGKDMIQGLINGIKSKIDAVGKAVGSVANKVKRFLHFSRPDEGPLRDYETWMPDFMSGLAAGIRQNASRVTQAVDALTRNMTINMQPMAFPAAASASGGTQTVTQPVSIAVNIDRLDNGSGQAPRAIAEQINAELQRIQQRSKAQW